MHQPLPRDSFHFANVFHTRGDEICCILQRTCRAADFFQVMYEFGWGVVVRYADVMFMCRILCLEAVEGPIGA